jgi:hypothetical protein
MRAIKLADVCESPFRSQGESVLLRVFTRNCRGPDGQELQEGDEVLRPYERHA